MPVYQSESMRENNATVLQFKQKSSLQQLADKLRDEGVIAMVCQRKTFELNLRK